MNQSHKSDALLRAEELVQLQAEQKLESVKALVVSSENLAAAEEQMREAVTAHERDWAAVKTAGWSDKDLREMGARAPGKQASKTRRPRIRPTEAESPNRQTQEDESSNQND